MQNETLPGGLRLQQALRHNSCQRRKHDPWKPFAFDMRLTIFLLISMSIIGAMARTCSAQAGPPLLTDDPGTPGKGHWEINFAATISQTRADRLLGAPLVDVNYGLGDRIQLKAEVPWLFLRPRDGGAVQSGPGSANIGVKWRPLDQDRHGFSMSLYPQFEFRTSAASARKHLIESEAELRLPVELSREFGKLAIDAELGYQFVRHAEDEWIYGVAVSRKFNERLEVLGEIHVEAKRDLTESEPIFNVGERMKLSRHCTLLLSVGRSLRAASSGQPTFVAYTGLQLHF